MDLLCRLSSSDYLVLILSNKMTTEEKQNNICFKSILSQNNCNSSTDSQKLHLKAFLYVLFQQTFNCDIRSLR